MPFVPLGSRKRIEVILDDDKHRLSKEMHDKDDATVRLHHQVMSGTSSYRYACHPETIGPVRGPPPPFATANKPWSPPEDHPEGGAAMKDLEHAPIGAFNSGAHAPIAETMRKSRSVPAMVRTIKANPVEPGGKSLGEQAKEKANPISIELSRWKRMAKVTERDLNSMPALFTGKHRGENSGPTTGASVTQANGLVNFPKYMLFENSHLKQQDLLRFIADEEKGRKEAEERHRMVEEAMSRGETPVSPLSTSRDPSGSEASALVPYATASWGQPRLRGPQSVIRNQWAGSAMPSGKSHRSSNPFRMG